MMNRILVTMIVIGGVAAAAPAAAQPNGPMIAATKLSGSPLAAGAEADDRADDLYDEGREAIEEGRYDRAVDRFNRVIELKGPRTDAALYWKAYSQHKLGQRADSLSTLADLQKRFPDSRWI